MANFDAAAGVTEDAFNDLVGQYYRNHPTDNDPFKIDVTKKIPPLGSVELKLAIMEAPTVKFGPPSEKDWNAAFNSEGKTNKENGNPLPSEHMVQLQIPKLTASYTVTGGKREDPMGGTTSNVSAYATVSSSGNDLSITVVAVKLDESNFTKWDKGIFNNFLLPRIFDATRSVLSVIHIPRLNWRGITLAPPKLFFADKLLVAACIEKGNPNPLDISGVTWPTKPMFALASQRLMNAALATEASINKTHSGSGSFSDASMTFGEKAADYHYQLDMKSVGVTVKADNPLEVNLSVKVTGTAGGKLLPGGMALAAAHCALAIVSRA